MSDVRSVLACLANEEVTRVFASVVLHGEPPQDVPRARQRKAIDALIRSGLITRNVDALGHNSAGIKATLVALRPGDADPLNRWLDPSGRIQQYPRRAKEREELLTAIGRRVVRERERINEQELNARLEEFASDVPTLRRYLVIHGVLARETDGSAYWRA